MITMLLSALGCLNFNEANCRASKNRLQAIRDQRVVLADLRGRHDLGKKKYSAIDAALFQEEKTALENLKLRCEQ
tara:strand:+ start:273 stop:497 length:225 start_codon:yes stop_codon:yes gene_type:complete